MDVTLHSPEICVIDSLPDDLLALILSFLPTLAEIARTSILSRRWRNIWRHITCLDFDAEIAFSHISVYISCGWYIAWVNKVLRARLPIHGFPSVKKLRIKFAMYAAHGKHIDRWINFAIANRVETIQVDLSHDGQPLYNIDLYKLSVDSLYRTPSVLSNIKYLKSLLLSCVSVSKQFVEFILSSCPQLEEMSLFFAKNCSDLDISAISAPLHLRRLEISEAEDFALTKLCAPFLTCLYHESLKFNPDKIDTPMLTDLAIGGGRYSQPIMEYLAHFLVYLPQLQKLHLIMDEDQEFRFEQMPTLMNLKYLKIQVDWDTDRLFSRIIDFIKACPVLETFAFQMFMGDVICSRHSSRERNKQLQWRELDKTCSFNCLKVLELYGFEGVTIDQMAVKCVIRKAPFLEKLKIDTCLRYRNYILKHPKPETVKAVEAKARKLCRKRPKTVDITVIS